MHSITEVLDNFTLPIPSPEHEHEDDEGILTNV